MSAAFVVRITKHFEEVTDPRLNRGANYPLIEMVFVALCGAICGCDSWVDVASFGKCEVANRPGHIEPRQLKRRRHGYKLMQEPRDILRARLNTTN